MIDARSLDKNGNICKSWNDRSYLTGMWFWMQDHRGYEKFSKGLFKDYYICKLIAPNGDMFVVEIVKN